MRLTHQSAHNLMLCVDADLHDYAFNEAATKSSSETPKDNVMFELLILSATAANVLAGYMTYSFLGY